MGDQKLNINLTTDNGQAVLVIREGVEANPLPLREKLKLKISGTIGAPAEFVTNHPDLDRKKGIVLLDEENGTIVFEEDPTDGLAAQITGIISLNPELDKFGINSDKKFGPVELSKLLKLNRYVFANKEEGMKVVADLQNVQIKSNSDLNLAKGNNGSHRILSERQVQENNIPESFKFNMPIFKGGTSYSFVVETSCDFSDNGTVRIWLESADLRELLHEKKQKALNEQLGIYEVKPDAVDANDDDDGQTQMEQAKSAFDGFTIIRK